MAVEATAAGRLGFELACDINKVVSTGNTAITRLSTACQHRQRQSLQCVTWVTHHVMADESKMAAVVTTAPQ